MYMTNDKVETEDLANHVSLWKFINSWVINEVSKSSCRLDNGCLRLVKYLITWGKCYGPLGAWSSAVPEACNHGW